MNTSTEIEELRDLLDVAERRKLELLELRIHQLEQQVEQFSNNKEFQTELVADVLPSAISKRGETDRSLTTSVQPHVIESISLSSRNQPDVMAAALYPVLGPAIRKMVASYFTFDRSKASFSPEQIFLIEPDSGLVVRHVSIESSPESSMDASGEADVISGMLEAIRSFVQDSFETNDHDGMRELSVGDITVMVEWGPSAILVCVVRGISSDEYRTTMQQSLQTIHAQFTEELASYEGDPETMAPVEPTLLSLLEHESSPKRSKSADSTHRNAMWVTVALFALICLVLFLIGT